MPPTRLPRLEVTFDPSADQWRERCRRVAGSLLGLFIGDLEKEFFPQSLLKIIRKRTAAGKDAEGQTFKPYAEGSDKHGPPNLSVTGELLRSLTARRDKDGFVVRPTGAHGGQSRTAQMLAGFLNSKGRTFLGYSPRDEDVISTDMNRVFANVTAMKIDAILRGRQ